MRFHPPDYPPVNFFAGFLHWNNFLASEVKIFEMEEGKFNRLSLNERADLLWDQGKFVDSMIYNNYCVMLYSVSRQFLEMYIDLKTSTIVGIIFANEHDLSKYLQDIQIEV